MKQDITTKEFIDILNTDKDLQKGILDWFEVYRETEKSWTTRRQLKGLFQDLINNKYTIKSLFIINVFRENKTNSIYIPHDIRKECENFYDSAIKYFINIENISFIEKIDKKELKNLLPSNILVKERARRKEIEFSAEAKTLNLDMFSYKIFEQFLSKQKALTSADALRYIEKLELYHRVTDKNERDTYHAYVKLLWNNTKTKSLALSKKILDMNMKSDNDSDLAIKQILYNNSNHTFLIDNQKKWNSSINFSMYSLISYAKDNHIPRIINSDYVSENDVHNYITGVPKKNAMTTYDVEFSIDKITILNHAKLKDETETPYYDMVIDQLVEELSKEKNIKEVEKISNIEVDNITKTLNKTNNIINEIKEKSNKTTEEEL